MNTFWRQISDNLQKKVNPGTHKVWIAPLRAEFVPASTHAAALLPLAHEPRESLSGMPESPSEGLPAVDASASASALASASENLLRVFAPNEFVAKWVRERLIDVIERAAHEVFASQSELAPHISGDLRLVIEVDPRAQAPHRPRHEASVQESVLVGGAESAAQTGVSLEQTWSAAQPEARPEPLPAPVRKVAPRAEQAFLPVRTVNSGFNWRYGFDDFVVGPCNDVAHAAARNMLPVHGAVDTLFLSSGPGLGKTHLTQAVGHALCAGANRTPKVEYLSAESFSTAFVQALKARDVDAFKARFRDVDVLLLEDVHFLQGKEKMQVEVLSTVKALQERGSRVVLTSSFAACELNNLDPTLVSRFCSGFLAGMEKPDFPTRRRILLDKAKKAETQLDDDVCDLLAERLTGDVRQLESCLNNLLLRVRLQGCPMSLAMAADILAQYAQDAPFFDLEAITRRVCEGFGLSPEQLTCRSRRTAHVTARNTVFYLARKHTELSLQDIGERFNRRHSTVLKGIAAVERELTRETSLGRQIAATLNIIEARTKRKSF